MRIHVIHMGPLLQMVKEGGKTKDKEGSEDSDVGISYYRQVVVAIYSVTKQLVQ